MMEIEPPSEEESGEFIRDVLAHMFHEIMSTSEMHDKFEELPTEPPIPYFRDIKNPPIGTRLVGVARTLGMDLKKRASKKDLKDALLKIGVRKSMPGMRPVYKELTDNAEDLTILQAYITKISSQAQTSIETTVAQHEDQIRAKMRRESIEEQQAAIKIQCLTRRKFARKQAEKKKRMATSQGRREDQAAIKIQAIQRRRAAQKKTEELANTKLQSLASKTMKDMDFQDSCWKVLENTMFNLLQEACHEEFDLYAVPKQYILAEELA